jgi:hypothetical protein
MMKDSILKFDPASHTFGFRHSIDRVTLLYHRLRLPSTKPLFIQLASPASDSEADIIERILRPAGIRIAARLWRNSALALGWTLIPPL